MSAPTEAAQAPADLVAAPGAGAAGATDNLILDLLEWIGPDGRPYAEVLDAWRTSCPRLPVWEDASERGFITRRSAPGRGTIVSVSSAGSAHLRAARTG